MDLTLIENEFGTLEITEEPVELVLEQQSSTSIQVEDSAGFVVEVFAGLKGDKGDPGEDGAGGGTGAVDSVNGQTGVVVLDAADVDALPDTYVPTWASITGKPSTFTPSTHNHDDRYYTESEIDTALGNKANSTHTHAQSDITGLSTALSGKANATHNHTSSEITDLTTAVQTIVNTQLDIAGAPGTLDTINELAAALGDDANFASTVTTALAGKASTSHNHDAAYAAISHTHAISNVTGLQSALDLKAPLASPTFTGTVTVPDNSFAIAKTSGLQTALDAKAPSANPTFTGTISVPDGSFTIAKVTNLQSSLDAKAPTASPTFTGTITVPDSAFAISKVSGLQTALDGKSATGHTHTAANVTDFGTTANTKRVSTTASTATLTLNCDTHDLSAVTAQAEALTVGAPTGTISAGRTIMFRFKDNGTARAITWNAVFRAIGVTLPTTTVANKYTYVGAIYNAVDSKFDVIAVGTEA